MSNSINENYISIEDAALFLNIKPVTLRKWIKDKNVPAHKIGKQWKDEFNSRQRKSNLRNICGTFAAEGMTISKYTRRNLGRIASGQTSYQQVLVELREKYEKRG